MFKFQFVSPWKYVAIKTLPNQNIFINSGAQSTKTPKSVARKLRYL